MKHLLMLLFFILSVNTHAQTACKSSPIGSNILIVAPHPDDEALMASGIIRSALRKNVQVTVAVVTNGDWKGEKTTAIRQAETLKAMSILGLTDANVIFLGYGNDTLTELLQKPVGSSEIVKSAAKKTATYGNLGLGHADFHKYRTGKSAPYSRKFLEADLQDLLILTNPDQIYITSEFDNHLDHSATYYFTKEAISEIQKQNCDFKPEVFQAIIHAGPEDQKWPFDFAPLTPLPEPIFMNLTTLNWNDRICFEVPSEMRTLNEKSNLKTIAIDAYESQMGKNFWGVKKARPWMISFSKSDEVFWKEQPLRASCLK